jgi:hypothetical protein
METKISVDNISKKCLKTLDAPTFPLSSKHNSMHLLPEELPADPLHALFVWLRRGAVVPLLKRPYNGPYAVLHWGPRFFSLRVESKD